MTDAYSFYPTAKEIDSWVDSLWLKLEKTDVRGQLLNQNGVKPEFGNGHTTNFCNYVEFSAPGERNFYGYWQPAASQPAPLIVHVPGYGAEMSIHPEMVAQGYNVLHINPLGYVTPQGRNEQLLENGQWPVLPDTVLGKAETGYSAWLFNCMLAIKWALKRPEVLPGRLSFVGTSQGGGGSLLLASIYKDKGARCVCAGVPFLTNFPLADFRGAYGIIKKEFEQTDPEKAWNRLGYIDTLSHAHRLTMPVMLTSGSLDTTCPPDTVESLFEKLPCTKSYTNIHQMGHCYSRDLLFLSLSWFRLYA